MFSNWLQAKKFYREMMQSIQLYGSRRLLMGKSEPISNEIVFHESKIIRLLVRNENSILLPVT